MSFDVNVLRQKPVIQAAANMQNDGGAGNLGYMEQGQKKKREEINIFMTKPDEPDVFVSLEDLEIPEDEKFDLVKWVKGLIAKIVKLFR